MTKIAIQPGGEILADKAEVARGFGKLTGLIGRRDLPEGSAVIISGCRQVHTFLMRFPIDVVFVDVEGRVLGVESLRPWRISRRWRLARQAVEFPGGTGKKIRIGDRLEIG